MCCVLYSDIVLVYYCFVWHLKLVSMYLYVFCPIHFYTGYRRCSVWLLVYQSILPRLFTGILHWCYFDYIFVNCLIIYDLHSLWYWISFSLCKLLVSVSVCYTYLCVLFFYHDFVEEFFPVRRSLINNCCFVKLLKTDKSLINYPSAWPCVLVDIINVPWSTVQLKASGRITYVTLSIMKSCFVPWIKTFCKTYNL